MAESFRSYSPEWFAALDVMADLSEVLLQLERPMDGTERRWAAETVQRCHDRLLQLLGPTLASRRSDVV
jgi:hypothetical protein